MAKIPQTPKIKVVDLIEGSEELRDMTDIEAESYSALLEESSIIIQNEKDQVAKKEIAIAKLVSLGLSEEDIKAMGL